jgi:hypothetical protein
MRDMTSAAGNRTRGDWVKTRHVTYYTTADTKKQKKRARIELANAKDLDLNQAHLTALLPLPRKRNATRALSPHTSKPLGRIELPTCSLRVNRSATELKRPTKERKTRASCPAQGGDRTHDLQINSLSHYRLCYSSQEQQEKASSPGIEPGSQR